MRSFEEFSEKKLVSLSKQGNQKAFEELISRDYSKIFSWIKSAMIDDLYAEEIYQQTMIKCWRKIKKFKGDSKFYTWANRVSRNLFYDLERKKKRRPTVSLDSILEEGGKDLLEVSELSPVEPKGFQNLALQELNKKIQRTLRKLSPIHREVLKLSAEQELTYEQISKKTKVPVGTVMSRLFYARKQAQKIYNSLR